MIAMQKETCTTEGAQKDVCIKEDCVIKNFKETSHPYSYEEQLRILKEKRKFFGKFMPKTELIKQDDGSYYIRQQRIKGNLLKFIDISSVDSSIIEDLIELIRGYISYCKSKKIIEPDIFGYQKINSNNIWIRRYYVYKKYLIESFLSSTNIMISDDNKVYMVDLCDSIPDTNLSSIEKIKYYVRNNIIYLSVELLIRKLEKLKNAKLKELHDNLNNG